MLSLKTPTAALKLTGFYNGDGVCLL